LAYGWWTKRSCRALAGRPTPFDDLNSMTRVSPFVSV